MTELNGAKSEEDRIMAITKIVLEVMKQNDLQSSQVVPKTALVRSSSNCK
jgi:hypothetical protein